MKTIPAALIVSSGLVLSPLSLLVAEQPVLPAQAPPAKTSSGELRCRALFGAQFGTVAQEARAWHKLAADGGVLIERNRSPCLHVCHES